MPIPPDPLYPPIYRDENGFMQLEYLDKHVKVKRYGAFDWDTGMKNLKFEIDGKDGIYGWDLVESRQGFWVMVRNQTVIQEYRTVVEGRGENFGEWHKIGIDFHHYLKQPHPDGEENPPYMTTMKLVLKQETL